MEAHYAGEEWTDDVIDAEAAASGEPGTLEERVEMELDEEADGLLDRALTRLRPPRVARRQATSHDANQAMEVESVEDPGGRGRGSRRSPTRRVQTRGRPGDVRWQ
jgi:anaphase-promoting complex subunit 6